ncbi:MAG: hypothetical protein ACRD4R_02345 [Candidatus Acidiferrales bacterium]
MDEVDLLPYVVFDIAAVESRPRQIHRDMKIIHVPGQAHERLRGWLDWLERLRAKPQEG